MKRIFIRRAVLSACIFCFVCVNFLFCLREFSVLSVCLKREYIFLISVLYVLEKLCIVK